MIPLNQFVKRSSASASAPQTGLSEARYDELIERIEMLEKRVDKLEDRTWWSMFSQWFKSLWRRG